MCTLLGENVGAESAGVVQMRALRGERTSRNSRSRLFETGQQYGMELLRVVLIQRRFRVSQTIGQRDYKSMTHKSMTNL